MGQNVNTLETISMVMIVIGQRNYVSVTIIETEYYYLNISMATVTITSKPNSPNQPCVVLLSNMMQLVIMKLWVRY